jgi:succinate dehydrogenase flavin-adding protein (antitoxin of CptAB toxin-antitoxin module)
MKILNWILNRETNAYNVVLQSCLTKEEADKLIKLDINKLIDVDTKERIILFSKYIGKEKAEWFNTLFEKDYLLKNQKEGMLNWVKQKTDIKEKYREDIIRKISKLEKALSPKEMDYFISELTNISLGLRVTLEEADNIADLSCKANEAKIKMENGGSKEDYEKAHNAFQDYVNKLKNKAKA